MTWLAPGGGVDNNVFLSIKHLRDDFEIHLATGVEIHHNIFAELEGLKFIVCKDLVRPISPLKDLKALIFFILLIRKEKYDIVHTHSTKASFITRIAAYFGGCKHIIYGLHGVTFNDPMSPKKRMIYVLIEKFSLWMVDLIVSVSKTCLEEYHKENIGVNIPYQVIHSGVDTKKFTSPSFTKTDITDLKNKLGIKETDKVLINIGRFSVAKAQIYTLQAFVEVVKRFPEAKIIFVGEGEEKDRCRSFVIEEGIEDNVIFFGFSDNIPLVLALADLCILTSLREGLPRVVVEASLCKVPTVSFEVEGIHEIITDKESGFVIYNRDIKELTKRVIEIFENPEMMNKSAEKAFEHVKTNWDYQIMVNKLERIYLSG